MNEPGKSSTTAPLRNILVVNKLTRSHKIIFFLYCIGSASDHRSCNVDIPMMQPGIIEGQQRLITHKVKRKIVQATMIWFDSMLLKTKDWNSGTKNKQLHPICMIKCQQKAKNRYEKMPFVFAQRKMHRLEANPHESRPHSHFDAAIRQTR